MKKIVSVIGFDPAAARFYTEQIAGLFGNFIEARTHSVLDGSVRNIGHADLYVVSTDAFEDVEDLRRFVPMEAETVSITLTYRWEVVERLLKLPKDTRALFVNLSEKMVREALARLSQLGVNHIDFTPYYPGAEPVSGFSLAVTPAESRYVPPGVEEIIDIGHRVLDSDTMVQIALRLQLDYLLEQDDFREYFRSVAADNYSFDHLFGRSVKIENRFEILMSILDVGVVGVNEAGRIFACNPYAAGILGLDRTLTLNLVAEEAFPEIPFAECRRTQAKVETRLVRIRGAEINVSAMPVLRSGEYTGAFAMLQRFSEEEARQNRLRVQLLNKGHKAKFTFEDIIGESEAITHTVEIARRMAATDSVVLITGESGTGKELFAHAIHNASKRADQPFVAINCAAITDSLLESELFGYEEGAFTGAKKGGRPGLFEFAHRGAIFLDEVESMSAALQVKLLRVVQEREIMRVGGSRIISVDVRIIAATNEHLEEMVAAGTFRKDLYYRLSALPVQVPPLRERGRDILVLFERFRLEAGASFAVTDEVRDILLHHRWDGNVRELRNYVEYFTCCGVDTITPADLPPALLERAGRVETATREKSPVNSPEYKVFAELAGNLEEEYIFVLGQLSEAGKRGAGLGREAILAAARQEEFPLSQGEVRLILNRLSDVGLIKKAKGRGGCKITPRGANLCKELN